MAKRSGIDQILSRWRHEVKAKQRRIISFEETVEIKINALKSWIFTDPVPLEGWRCRQFRYTRHRERRFMDRNFRPIKAGETWGGPDTSALFRCRARMPAQLKGRKVALKIYFGGDGLLNVNGRPYHGLDPFRDTVILTEKATGKETFDFEAECYIFWHFGESEVKTFEISQFTALDQEMNDTYWDFRAAWNVLVMAELDPEVREFLKAGVAKAIAPLDQNETDAARFRANARVARQILRREIYASDRFQRSGLLHLCGNSHLDVVFLWTHAEFVRKLARTHASTLRLMEQFPEYTFSQSQPLMYQEMKDHFPAMFEEVKQRVKQGRWEVIGAFWVEPDCNLISGESFVRQSLYGTQFLRKEFGVTPRTCWMPDVFGNTWTMPQILRKCGMQYFVTHKMVVWNDTNPWTKNTFWWQGPDGSRVLAVVPPTHFIGTVEPDHMGKHWANYNDKDTIGESLYNYGWGDGGGGPDPEMLEYLRRYRSFPGVTPTRPGTIENALGRMSTKAQQAEMPVWNDELYLEEHRGTFTTKARLKKLNRRCEFLYREAELLSVLAGGAYPREKLDAGWKDVLNNQFHDSLPGSHIPPVYLDLKESYDRALAVGAGVRDAALRKLAARVDTRLRGHSRYGAAKARGTGRAIVVFNSLPIERDATVWLDAPAQPAHVCDANGIELPSQIVEHPETGRPMLVFVAAGLPQVGYKVFRLVHGTPPPSPMPARGEEATGVGSAQPLSVSKTLLENKFLRVKLNAAGELVSLFDKTQQRECLDTRGGNVLKLYEDVPGRYEAWDIAPSYTKVEFGLGAARVEIVERGPVRAAIRVTRQFRGSKLVQNIVLTRGARRVDFETYVDWHEQQKLLKARFFTPLVTRTASYDIAYGNIERSAYRNNSFDAAKFEVPAHLWMDLSQPDFGVSLLNDCKYGHEAFDGMLALTLLRGPTNPDPESDQEEHRFVYALYPHTGTWREGRTYDQALDLNVPALAVVVGSHGGPLPARKSLLTCAGEYVTLEALKQAETSGHVILRLVERYGRRGTVKLTLPWPLAEAFECNLLEEEDARVPFDGAELVLEIKPYEIRTLKLKPARTAP